MTEKTFGEEIFPDHKLVTMPDGRRVSVRCDACEAVDLVQTEDGHHRFVDFPAEISDGLVRLKNAESEMATGALVQLNSGGPVMTVQTWKFDEAERLEYIETTWFDGAKLCRGGFHWSMLKLAGVVLEKRPVAWRERRTGIIYTIESDAYLACEGNDRGNVEGLYLRDGT